MYEEIKSQRKIEYLVVCFVILLFLICSFLIYKNNKTIEMPNVVGQFSIDGIKQLESVKLKNIEIIEVESNQDHEVIISQMPDYGEKVRKNEKVRIVINK